MCIRDRHNTDNHETAFTVSIDHVSTSTGISAAERSITAMACCLLYTSLNMSNPNTLTDFVFTADFTDSNLLRYEIGRAHV